MSGASRQMTNTEIAVVIVTENVNKTWTEQGDFATVDPDELEADIVKALEIKDGEVNHYKFLAEERHRQLEEVWRAKGL